MSRKMGSNPKRAGYCHKNALIQAGEQQSRPIGRKPSVDRKAVRSLHAQGVGATEIANRPKIGRSTVYNVLAD